MQFPRCSWQIDCLWAAQVLLTAGFLAFFFWQAHVALQQRALRLQAGGCQKAVAGWSASHLSITAGVTFAAGIIGGTLGISGGMIMVPVLLGERGSIYLLWSSVPLLLGA